MMGVKAGLGPVVVGVIAVALQSCAPQSTLDLAINGATVIDVETGSARQVNIGVKDGVIAKVTPRRLRSTRSVDAGGLWAIPGLWDMHVHIADPSYFDLMVANGVVGARDMGGDLDAPGDGCSSVKIEALRQWRDEIDAGVRIGPRLRLAGPVASGNNWTGRDQAAAARAAVNAAADRGADFIKVYENVTPDGFAALMDEARRRRLPVAGHVSVETLTILAAINAGQRSIEHVRAHLLLCFADDEDELAQFYDADEWNDEDREWGARHRADCPAIWAALRAGGVWLTPTLAVERTQIDAVKQGFEDDPRRDRLPAAVREGAHAHAARMRARQDQPNESALSENWWKTQLRFVGKAQREGAPMLAGSDAACEGVIPGFGLVDQLTHFVDAGMTPLQSLATATIEPAKYFDRADRAGRIAPGYDADMVLLAADPRQSIEAVRRPQAVVLRGAYYDRAALAEIYAGAGRKTGVMPKRPK
jgi:imidazolonepropionase-like amidohydrolase